MSDSVQVHEYQSKARRAHENGFFKSAGPEFTRLFNRVSQYTMLPAERLFDLHNAAKYIESKKISGDIYEIGVWAGGALGMSALSFKDGHARTFYGFDTFEGHGRPDAGELDIWGRDQQKVFDDLKGQPWAAVSQETVQENLAKMGVTAGVNLVKGKAEDTLPGFAAGPISVLRIDVDWYPPTMQALEELYPKLSVGGVVIIDDYGHHSGCREAVDKYFKDMPLRWVNVDYSCITAIKV